MVSEGQGQDTHDLKKVLDFFLSEVCVTVYKLCVDPVHIKCSNCVMIQTHCIRTDENLSPWVRDRETGYRCHDPERTCFQYLSWACCEPRTVTVVINDDTSYLCCVRSCSVATCILFLQRTFAFPRQPLYKNTNNDQTLRHSRDLPKEVDMLNFCDNLH